jgi:hypothetical protein
LITAVASGSPEVLILLKSVAVALGAAWSTKAIATSRQTRFITVISTLLEFHEGFAVYPTGVVRKGMRAWKGGENPPIVLKSQKVQSR